LSLLPGDQHDSEASFVSRHACVSYGGSCQRNGFFDLPREAIPTQWLSEVKV
jgi:hypothetical protein